MIDYVNRLIFIHVPRTAGTSIVAAMGRGTNPDWRLEHANWAWHKERFPDLWQTFRKVAILREPEAHARSWFEYHKMWFSGHLQANNYRPYIGTFEEWTERGRPWHEDWTSCGVQGSPVDQQEFVGPAEEGVIRLDFGRLQQEWKNFVSENWLPKGWETLPRLNARI